jgi:hypothetical protein
MNKTKNSATRRSSRAVSARTTKGEHGVGVPPQQSEEDEERLPPAIIEELKRRLRDSRDPVRYMLVSEFSRRFILYYNVSSDTYVMNEPSGGTLFKRREAAESVKKLLGKRISIVKYTKKHGKLKPLSQYHSSWSFKAIRPHYAENQTHRFGQRKRATHD